MESLQKLAAVRISEVIQMNKHLSLLGFVACILFFCDLMLHALLDPKDSRNYTSISCRLGEFQCLKAGRSLIIGRNSVEIDEASVVVGTNRTPLVVSHHYVYVCGKNDIKVFPILKY